ncbi:MAG TPA: hypothetical protein VK465_05915 [Fibrobacteria bacterium]|nr:hypothetical protein [Fibrobacteria bacterium]
MPDRPEVKAARPPTTRTEPDKFPPMHFSPPPARSKFLGIPLPFRKSGITQGAKLKEEILVKNPYRFKDIEPIVMKDHPDLAEIVREHSPNYDRDPSHMKSKAMNEALKCHPKYLAIRLQHLNATHRQPTVATATRTMTPGEQTFLTDAFQRIHEDVQKKPFHIHGESAVIGNKKGEITDFHHEAKAHVGMPIEKGDKYYLHTHPPLWEPATSSASLSDHKNAAFHYFEDNRKILSFVTNGKDVLHIQPASMELVKLIPDSKMEETLGKFPIAFKLPDPQQPPYPFSNHEAPGAL